MRRPILILAALCVCSAMLSTSLRAADKPMRVLFVTQSIGFLHNSVKRTDTLAPAEIALTQLGEQSGLFKVDCTQDCEADFTKENLAKYDIVAFYTTGQLPISDETFQWFLKDWLAQKGHGVLGFHSAMDTFPDYEPYWDLIGGNFLKHPWNAGDTVTLANHEPENPLTKAFGPELVLKEEIYMYKHWQPEKVRVLLSLDYAKSPIQTEVDTTHGYHVPVCWIKQVGEGRVYCNNLGHNETSWVHPQYQESITQAVKWIRGDFDVDTTPNPEVSKAQEEKARKDFVEHGFKAKP